MILQKQLALFALAACGLAALAFQGQEPKVKTKEVQKTKEVAGDVPQAVEIQVMQIQNGPAAAVKQAVYEIYGVAHGLHLAVLEPTNTLVVRAYGSKMAEIREFIDRLQQELLNKSDDNRYRMRIIQLKNQPDEALEKSLELLLRPDGGKYSLDRVRRQIIWEGRDIVAKNIDDYIARWDVAPGIAATSGDIQVRVIWFTHVDEPSPMPDEFKQLIPALNRVGINKKPYWAATYALTAKPSTPFSTIGTMPGGGTTIRISGQYDDRKTPPALSLSIRDNFEDGGSIFDIKTELSAPLGHLIVLAASRYGDQQMAFVVQVTRAESVNPAAKP